MTKTIVNFIVNNDCEIKISEIIHNIITWLNANDGFTSALLALITALAAIFIPVCTAKKQNKIALFQVNLKCYRSLNSIMIFCAFVSEFTTFEENHDSGTKAHSPVEACRGKYLEMHDLLSDKKVISQIRSSDIWKTTFIKNCISLDYEAICSGAFLTKAITLNDAEKITKTLDEFVIALFDSKDPTIITEKCDAFVKNRVEIHKLIDALSKRLEV